MKVAIIVVVVLLVGTFAVLSLRQQDATAQASQPTTSPSNTVVGVEEFMKNVDKHKGSVTVEGVVSAAVAEKKLLTLIDVREFEHCGLQECAEYTLPVEWSGSMPAVKDAVRVSGQIREASGGKLVFAASSVEKATKAEASK